MADTVDGFKGVTPEMREIRGGDFVKIVLIGQGMGDLNVAFKSVEVNDAEQYVFEITASSFYGEWRNKTAGVFRTMGIVAQISWDRVLLKVPTGHIDRFVLEGNGRDNYDLVEDLDDGGVDGAVGEVQGEVARRTSFTIDEPNIVNEFSLSRREYLEDKKRLITQVVDEVKRHLVDILWDSFVKSGLNISGRMNSNDSAVVVAIDFDSAVIDVWARNGGAAKIMGDSNMTYVDDYDRYRLFLIWLSDQFEGIGLNVKTDLKSDIGDFVLEYPLASGGENTMLVGINGENDWGLVSLRRKVGKRPPRSVGIF